MILVLPDGTQYKSHKLLLAYNSNWFMEYFTKGAPPAPLSDDDNESMSSNSSKSSNAPEATDVETQEAKQATQPSTTSTSDSANGMLVVHLPWPDEGKVSGFYYLLDILHVKSNLIFPSDHTCRVKMGVYGTSTPHSSKLYIVFSHCRALSNAFAAKDM